MSDLLSDSELMLNFESIGDNCEFGVVQRNAGAEPLGLLRFAGAPVRHLIRALEHRFAGIAEPENVRVQPENGEYMIKLAKQHFIYHSNALEHQMDRTELHRQEVRRIGYLAKEFVADLETPTKILVFRQNEPLLAHDLALLRAALRRYATHTMLWVLEAQPGHPPGTVEVADDHLMLGYVRWLAPRNDAPNADQASWLSVLRAAHSLWRSAERDDSLHTSLHTRLTQPTAGFVAPAKVAASFGPDGSGPAPDGVGRSVPDTSFARSVSESATASGHGSHGADFNPVTEKLTVAASHAMASDKGPTHEPVQRLRASEAAALIEAARAAQRRGDRQEALRCWAVLQQRFPDEPMGYAGAATAHRDAGEFDQADALLNRAQARFPDVPWLFVEYAWVAHIRRDWPEAASRWEMVRVRLPDAPVGYAQGAAALRELGRLEEAQALLRQAATHFPTDPQAAIGEGRHAQVRGEPNRGGTPWGHSVADATRR
jgi:hypothetical protein